MEVVKPSFKVLSAPSYDDLLILIEMAGRTCYKSEDKISRGSAEKLVKTLIKNGHHSVIEHGNISLKIICDRGVTHELVRHRLAAYSQESTRYCNYSRGKFNNEICCIRPYFWKTNSHKFDVWAKACESAEKYYMELLGDGASPQEARSVLPNSLKTEIVITANIREWRHITTLRTSPRAHPQMREVMMPILKWAYTKYPVFFQDIYHKNYKEIV